MCISTVNNRNTNRSRCNVEDVQTYYFNSWTQVNREWSSSEQRCPNDNIVTIVLKELDVTNVVREIKFNFSIESNFTEVIINESEHNFPNTMWIVRPTWEVALTSSLTAPLILFGVAMNLILLILLAKCKWLHTSTNLLVGNMALADTCTLMLCPWMLLINNFYQNYELGEFGCKIEGFITGALLITSVMNILAISYDRLTAIVVPKETRMSRQAIVYLALSTWIIGIIFALPLSIWRYYKERQWLNFLEKYCTENIHILPMYWHILIFILVWIPLIVMTICYTAIFYKLDKYEQQILRHEHPISVKYKTRVARTIFAVLLTFVICRTPFTVLIFWRSKLLKEEKINAVSTSFHTLWFTSHYMMYLNCAINPLIYGLTNEFYRKAFTTTAFCKWFTSKSSTEKSPSTKPKVMRDSNLTVYYKFWYRGIRGGKLELDDKTKSNNNNLNSSSPKKPSHSPIISSKITPITNDYI